MTISLILGVIGAALLLLAFILNELHVWNEDDLIYDGVNFLGALLLTLYAWFLHSWPFGILNGFWCLVSLRDIVLDLRRKSV